MTQKDKQLLLVDLYARLPYGVKFKADNEKCIREIHYIKDENVYIREYRNLSYWVDTIKPYLRPMLSMTEEEEREVRILWNEDFADKISFYHCYPKTTDFYNKHHLDYRGLIPMGLALEAPEDMYKTE